jgi:hypothetical protein
MNGFEGRFGVTPKVKYIEEYEINSRYCADFKRSYKEISRPKITKTRQKQFEAYFRNLKKRGSDYFYSKRVCLKYINKKVGYGVFANVDIPPYSTLCHYVGKVILTKNLKAEHDSTFSFNHFEKYSIDAMKKGNWARFMNHSDLNAPSNNVLVWEYYAKDFPYIVFTSGHKRIKKGTQLLYSYGEEYWKDRKSLKLK